MLALTLLSPWVAVPIGLVLLVLVALLTVWWRQQTFRWALVLGLCLLLAPMLSWWSGQVFRVEPYRAGCDAMCVGRAGAPMPTAHIDGEGETFLPSGFAINTLLYLALALGWLAVVRALLVRVGEASRRPLFVQTLLALLLCVAPLALSPLFLPAPQARARGDPLRVAINAAREVYMYDQEAPALVLRVGLEDVRPRIDGQQGMRVCLRAYTFFYLPAGYLYLDMTPEGVHSNTGGSLPNGASCWP
jgi:hypothetical protein